MKGGAEVNRGGGKKTIEKIPGKTPRKINSCIREMRKKG